MASIIVSKFKAKGAKALRKVSVARLVLGDLVLRRCIGYPELRKRGSREI